MNELVPSAGQMDGPTHLLPIRVYYEDTDFTGVVYHGAYVRFFERGRSDFLRLAGIHHAELQHRADPMAFAVTRIEIDFKRAAKIGDRVGCFLSVVGDTGLFLGWGTYVGDEVPPNEGNNSLTAYLAGERRSNPKILLESGEVVWGCEWHRTGACYQRLSSFLQAAARSFQISQQGGREWWW